MDLLSPVLDVFLGKNWFADIDKKELCGICGISSMSIDHDFGQQFEAYKYMDDEGKRTMFTAMREPRFRENQGYDEIFKDTPPSIKNIKKGVLPDTFSFYYESDTLRVLVAHRKRTLEFRSTLLSFEQLRSVALHFMEKGVL